MVPMVCPVTGSLTLICLGVVSAAATVIFATHPL
jgi:hypothetical protein